MKLKFRGWRREVKPHSHEVLPVTREKASYSASATGPLVWESHTRVIGKLTGLGLTGDFLLEIEVGEAELHSWLQRYVDEKPDAALQLLCEMQAKAILALHRQPHTAER